MDGFGFIDINKKRSRVVFRTLSNTCVQCTITITSQIFKILNITKSTFNVCCRGKINPDIVSELQKLTYNKFYGECGEIWSIFPYSVRMRENAHQNNSGYGHFSSSETFLA